MVKRKKKAAEGRLLFLKYDKIVPMIDTYLAKNYFIHQKLSDKQIEKIYGKNFNHLLANLLYVRGIKNLKEAEKFLNPR